MKSGLLFRGIILGLGLCLLQGCAEKPVPPEGSRYTRTVLDNNFNITFIKDPVQKNDGKTSYHTKVYVAEKPWKGSLAGGEEKFEERKKVMQDLTLQEMKKECKTDAVSIVGEPFFMMRDNNIHNPYRAQTISLNPVADLIGMALRQTITYAIAEAATDNENIPISLETQMTCPYSPPVISVNTNPATTESTMEKQHIPQQESPAP
jgi:hypothetical protein